MSYVETSIYRPQDYPPMVLAQLKRQPPLSITIANRWMRGWPKVVKEHLADGMYMSHLLHQEELERQALSHPGNSHLAQHEITELYGLRAGPPPLPATTT